MAPRFFTVLIGRNLPKIRQSREPEPSIINEKTIADFTRVVEQTGILARELAPVSKVLPVHFRNPESDSAGPGRDERWPRPPSPDAGTLSGPTAGTSFTAMFKRARSRSA